MLLRTIFVLALVAIVGETIVHGAAALAAQALHQRALQASKTAFVSGVLAAQNDVGQTIAANPNATSFPLPSPMATCAYAGNNGCEMNAAIAFASPTPAASLAPSQCPATDCTIVLQANSSIAEGRTSVVISTTVSSAAGATLATRSGIVAFRTFELPPYVSIVGGVDASVDALVNGGAADDAGSASSLITVQYAPIGGGAATSGNVWQARTESSATSEPAWER